MDLDELDALYKALGDAGIMMGFGGDCCTNISNPGDPDDGGWHLLVREDVLEGRWPVFRRVLGLVRSWAGRGESRVLVHGDRVPAPDAGLVNGVMGRARDFDDVRSLHRGRHQGPRDAGDGSESGGNGQPGDRGALRADDSARDSRGYDR